MKRSLFTFIVALSSAVALASTNGCLDEDAAMSSDAAADDKDVLQPLPKKDTGPDVEEDVGPARILLCCGDCGGIDATSFPWKPPTRAPGSCTDADVGAMIAFIETTPTATFEQLQESITNVACRDCVFATETTTWAPIVLNAAGTGVVALNVGGCPAILSGKEDCGRKIQQWNDCLDEACVDCSGFPECPETARKKDCKNAFDAMIRPTACGDAASAQAAMDACNRPEDKYTFIGGVRAQCVGLSDAGDAGGD